jgi:hypothetical protein
MVPLPPRGYKVRGKYVCNKTPQGQKTIPQLNQSKRVNELPMSGIGRDNYHPALTTKPYETLNRNILHSIKLH